jgi:hypothetical protein
MSSLLVFNRIYIRLENETQSVMLVFSTKFNLEKRKGMLNGMF